MRWVLVASDILGSTALRKVPTPLKLFVYINTVMDLAGAKHLKHSWAGEDFWAGDSAEPFFTHFVIRSHRLKDVDASS